MNPRPFFANGHIPKCGGTTFRTVLARNFRGRYEEVYNPIWEAPYTAAQIAFFVDDSPGYDCLSSNRLSLDLPFEGTRRPVIALAFVRDPVDGLFSHYHYERGRSYRRQRFACLGEMSPAQYVEHVLGSASEEYLLDANTVISRRTPACMRPRTPGSTPASASIGPTVRSSTPSFCGCAGSAAGIGAGSRGRPSGRRRPSSG